MSLGLFLRRNDAQLQADAQLVHMIWFRDGFSLSNLGRCSGVTLGLLCHAAQSRLSFGCCSEVASLATVTRGHGEHGGCSCEPRRVCSWLSFCLVGLAAVIMKPCLGVHLGALVEALALCPSRTLEPWSQQTRSRAARVDSLYLSRTGFSLRRKYRTDADVRVAQSSVCQLVQALRLLAHTGRHEEVLI